MRILVARYRFIGDTVLMIPFLRNLRYAYPDAVIDVLVGPVSGDVLNDCPYINELIVFDTTRKHRYENKNEEKQGFFSYVKLLKSRKYDKVYVLKRSLSSALLTFLAGIPERIGFNTEGRGIFLTKRVPYVKDRHEVECFLDVLRADGLEIKDNHLENWVNQSSNDKIEGIFKALDITDPLKVLIHATSGNVNKQWPPEYFAEVIKYLSNNLSARVFYTGTQKDAELYAHIRTLIGNELAKEPVNLCGKLSIADSTALISRMNMAIGSDSGTLHIAASLNVPVIGIYGPMNHVKWRAWGDMHEPVYLDLPCIPCELKKKCPRNIACLRELKPEMVIERINRIIDKAKTQR
jgi:heptosyltransferase-2